MRWLVVVVVGAACGRVSFDPGRAPDASAPDAIDVDAVAPNIGCVDGEREAFVDPVMFPTIAGCAATWAGMVDLAQPINGLPCGDDAETCAHPRNACAPGWHPCAENGNLAELLVVTGTQCHDAATGRFVAIRSHTSSAIPVCEYVMPFTCRISLGSSGSQPICCGAACHMAGCPDGVWPGETYETVDSGQSCAEFPATEAEGILCCRT